MVSLAFMDRTTPTDYDEGTDVEGNKKPGCRCSLVGFLTSLYLLPTSVHVWTYKYAVLLHSVMAIAFGPRPPPYSSILDLDLKIRNFPVPAQWRPVCDPEGPPPPPEIHMARFLVSFAKESSTDFLFLITLGLNFLFHHQLFSICIEVISCQRWNNLLMILQSTRLYLLSWRSIVRLGA